MRGITTTAHMQKAICLHMIPNKEVLDVSRTIFKGLHACSLEQAERAVKVGHAIAEDFWLLVGFCGWGPGQLLEEIGFHDWHVSTASASFLDDLITNTAASDAAQSGIAAWESAMVHAGLQEQARAAADCFQDRMLREWVKMYLSHITTDPTLVQSEAMDSILREASRRQVRAACPLAPGTLLRTSAVSPYILEQQYLHKALILVLHDTLVRIHLPDSARWHAKHSDTHATRASASLQLLLSYVGLE